MSLDQKKIERLWTLYHRSNNTFSMREKGEWDDAATEAMPQALRKITGLQKAFAIQKEEIEKLRASAPRWTTEPPTEPGWYWAKHAIRTISPVEVVWAEPVEGGCLITGSDQAHPFSRFTHWQRIEAPEVPE